MGVDYRLYCKDCDQYIESHHNNFPRAKAGEGVNAENDLGRFILEHNWKGCSGEFWLCSDSCYPTNDMQI